MKQILQNPIFVQLEANLVGDIIKLIGQASHKNFSNDDINLFKDHLKAKCEEAIRIHQDKKQEKPENAS